MSRIDHAVAVQRAVADPGFWKGGFSSNFTWLKAVHRGVQRWSICTKCRKKFSPPFFTYQDGLSWHFILCTASFRCSQLAILLVHSLGLLVKKLVMGRAAGFFLELMLFIGFKYKLNMTVWLGHGNPLHLAYSAQYFKSSAQNSLGCTVLENCQAERIQVNRQSC